MAGSGQSDDVPARGVGSAAPLGRREGPGSPGSVLRERAPGPFSRRAWPEPSPRGLEPRAPRPGWGRRIVGGLLLVGTVAVVSCQSFVSAVWPGAYG